MAPSVRLVIGSLLFVLSPAIIVCADIAQPGNKNTPRGPNGRTSSSLKDLTVDYKSKQTVNPDRSTTIICDSSQLENKGKANLSSLKLFRNSECGNPLEVAYFDTIHNQKRKGKDLPPGRGWRIEFIGASLGKYNANLTSRIKLTIPKTAPEDGGIFRCDVQFLPNLTRHKDLTLEVSQTLVKQKDGGVLEVTCQGKQPAFHTGKKSETLGFISVWRHIYPDQQQMLAQFEPAMSIENKQAIFNSRMTIAYVQQCLDKPAAMKITIMNATCLDAGIYGCSLFYECPDQSQGRMQLLQETLNQGQMKACPVVETDNTIKMAVHTGKKSDGDTIELGSSLFIFFSTLLFVLVTVIGFYGMRARIESYTNTDRSKTAVAESLGDW